MSFTGSKLRDTVRLAKSSIIGKHVCEVLLGPWQTDATVGVSAATLYVRINGRVVFPLNTEDFLRPLTPVGERLLGIQRVDTAPYGKDVVGLKIVDVVHPNWMPSLALMLEDDFFIANSDDNTPMRYGVCVGRIGDTPLWRREDLNPYSDIE